jgi:hypothetical protein
MFNNILDDLLTDKVKNSPAATVVVLETYNIACGATFAWLEQHSWRCACDHIMV